jgi:ATP-dependent DNA ligase
MPFIQPMPLGRKPAPFDHPEWIYELKYDGFRALAAVEYGRCALFSRNGHPFASFSELAILIRAHNFSIQHHASRRQCVTDSRGLCWASRSLQVIMIAVGDEEMAGSD